MGYEEVDYSEEAKYDLFESVRRERLDWARCLISRTPPSYEQILEGLHKHDLSLTRKDYEKLCKEMGM
jgi:hypothetical protein